MTGLCSITGRWAEQECEMQNKNYSSEVESPHRPATAKSHQGSRDGMFFNWVLSAARGLCFYCWYKVYITHCGDRGKIYNIQYKHLNMFPPPRPTPTTKTC